MKLYCMKDNVQYSHNDFDMILIMILKMKVVMMVVVIMVMVKMARMMMINGGDYGDVSDEVVR